MKKIEFYTMVMRDGKPRAESVKGYTDGTFYYYRNADCKTWHAVHPMVGLSVARADTLHKIVDAAYEPDRLKFINEEIDKRGAVLSANYAVAVAEAQEVR
jgi:hypothetical protein